MMANNHLIVPEYIQPSKFRQILIKIYQEPYGITLIKGFWKTGKTNFGFKLYEILKEMKLINEAAGNIQTFQDPECLVKGNEVIYIDNFAVLKNWMFKYSNISYDKVPRRMFFFDEAMGNAPSKKAMTLLNAEWQRVIPELSKAKIHLVAITQEESMTERIFTHPTFNIAKWEKINLPPHHPQFRKRVKVTSKLLNETYIFNNISACRTIYHPGRSATWSMDPISTESVFESLPEFKIAAAYCNGMSTDQICVNFPEIKDRKEATRAIRKALKMFFQQWQVAKDSSG